MSKLAMMAYFRHNWLALFSAFVLGLGLPLWKMFIWESADVQVEVTSLDKTSATVTIDIERDPGLRSLFRELPFMYFGVQDLEDGAEGLTLEEVETFLRRSENQLLEMEERLGEMKDLRKRIDQQFSADLVRELNRPLSSQSEITVPTEVFTESQADRRKEFQERFATTYEEEIREFEDRIRESRKNLDAGRKSVTDRRQVAELKESRVIVECAASNSGAGSISLRPQALLRVYLGGDNYFDIELQMDSYEKKGNLPPRSSSIIRLQSDLLGKMGEPEQERVNSYFTQNVPTRLFLVDINGGVHESNTIPFARGLYDQTVYDRLRREASDYRAPELR